MSTPSLPLPARTSASAPPSLLARLTATGDDPLQLGLRVVLAAVMLPHGIQHALGGLGGFGFAGTYGWMTGTLGIPGPFAALAILTELVAPVLLVAGLLGRAAAGMLGAVLAVAATTHLSNGFFMNWLGQQKGEGFEYHLLGVALAAAVAVRGSGALSLDRWIARTRDAA